MSTWTGDLADVAAICGEDVAQALHDTMPGILLYVPRNPRKESPVTRLDPEIATRLMAEFGGDTISVPSKRKSSQERFKEIEVLLDKGLTTAQIAVKLGITQTYVFQLRRKVGAPRIAQRPDPRQLSLFEDEK